MIPQVGDTVVYVSDTGEVVAQITAVGADGRCHLTITMVAPADVETEQAALAARIADGSADPSERIVETHTATAVQYSDSNAVGTWHWPVGG